MQTNDHMSSVAQSCCRRWQMFAPAFSNWTILPPN